MSTAPQTALCPMDAGATFLRERSWEGVSVAHTRVRTCAYTEHTHDEHQVVILLGASLRGRFTTRAGLRLSGLAAAGNIIVLPSGNQHAVEGEGDVEYLKINLDPGLVARAAPEAGSSRASIAERWVSRDPVIWQIGAAFRAALDDGGPRERLFAESLASVLVAHLLASYPGAAAEARRSGGLAGATLRRATDFIRDNLGREVSLGEIAGAAGLSQYHFAREFKRATGLTPHQFVTRERVLAARRLLETTRLPLVEVGLRSGFSSQSHFTRVFHKETAMTPGRYRESAGGRVAGAIAARSVNDEQAREIPAAV